MHKHKYFLDLHDLQFKRVRRPWKERLIRLFFGLAGSVILSVFYNAIFFKHFGSPKEKLLRQEIEDIKLNYSLLGRNIDNSEKILDYLELSDGNCYRPVLDMDSIPGSVRRMGIGGVNRYEELEGYENTGLMISYVKKVENLRNRSTVQYESFRAIEERKNEWSVKWSISDDKPC
jgi:hypothetical protein